jgi:predicted RNA binding protein YcfA (HicA-like mRNA interferase family)
MSGAPAPLEARHLLKTLKDEGWYLGESASACRQYVHKERPGRITVCVRYTDQLGPETLASVPTSGSGAAPPAEPGAGSEPEMVLEATSSGFSAYAPALPGCVATGASEAEVRRRMGEAMRLHREGYDGVAGE